MADFLRILAGLFLLPSCWGATRAFMSVVVTATGSASGVATLAFLGGVVLFVFCWLVLPHPVRTYVFAHEMTHALWGLFFGARPSKLRVGAQGGSVRLSKTNVFITLAPYFFPFYAFLVSVAAVVVRLFLGRLPGLPVWLFLIGFTWTFHVLFTLETLAQRQPDVTLYGRIFSWTFIYLGNVLLIYLWLVGVTSQSFAATASSLASAIASAYVGVGSALAYCAEAVRGFCARK